MIKEKNTTVKFKKVLHSREIKKEYYEKNSDDIVSSIKLSIENNNDLIEKGISELLKFPNKYEKCYSQDCEEVEEELNEECWQKAKDLCEYIIGDSNCLWLLSCDTSLMQYESIDIRIATGDLMNFYIDEFSNISYHLSVNIKNREVIITKFFKEIIEDGDYECISYVCDGREEYFSLNLP